MERRAKHSWVWEIGRVLGPPRVTEWFRLAAPGSEMGVLVTHEYHDGTPAAAKGGGLGATAIRFLPRRPPSDAPGACPAVAHMVFSRRILGGDSLYYGWAQEDRTLFCTTALPALPCGAQMQHTALHEVPVLIDTRAFLTEADEGGVREAGERPPPRFERLPRPAPVRLLAASAPRLNTRSHVELHKRIMAWVELAVRAFLLAREHGVEVVVSGAWGAEAGGCPPEVSAAVQIYAAKRAAIGELRLCGVEEPGRATLDAIGRAVSASAAGGRSGDSGRSVEAFVDAMVDLCRLSAKLSAGTKAKARGAYAPASFSLTRRPPSGS